MIASNSKQLPKPTKNRYLVPNPHENWDTESTPYRDDEDTKRVREAYTAVVRQPCQGLPLVRQHAGGNPPQRLELFVEDITWGGLVMDVTHLPILPPPPMEDRPQHEDLIDCCIICGTGPLAPTTQPDEKVICAICR